MRRVWLAEAPELDGEEAAGRRRPWPMPPPRRPEEACCRGRAPLPNRGDGDEVGGGIPEDDTSPLPLPLLLPTPALLLTLLTVGAEYEGDVEEDT